MRSAQDAQIPENPAPVAAGVSTAGGDEEGKGKESPSLLKPQHEQFAQNIAQGMPRFAQATRRRMPNRKPQS
ncbi:TPA: hypothetical protein RYX73_003778 [Serratia marcescens]|nr:hypothetical protein [Serratia marcescens]